MFKTVMFRTFTRREMDQTEDIQFGKDGGEWMKDSSK